MDVNDINMCQQDLSLLYLHWKIWEFKLQKNLKE